jgi:hypothetical protein
MSNPNLRESTEASLPTVTAGVVESAVTLAKAEIRLAIVEARVLILRVISAVAWVLLAGFCLQVAVALLVLGPLLTMDMSTTARWLTIIAPSVVALGICVFAFTTINKVRHEQSPK